MPWDKDTLRAFADQYLPAAIEEAGITSMDKYYQWLRENELPVTREIARQAWRAYGEATNYADVLRVWDEWMPIPRAWYGETTAKGVKFYKYNVDLDLLNAVTEEPEKDTWYIYSDKALKKSEIKEYVEECIQKYYPEIWSKLLDYKIKAAYHKQGAAW